MFKCVAFRSAGREWMRSMDSAARNLISVIDDDEDVREAISGLIESLGFTVDAFASGVDFLGSPSIRDTLCVIADVHMPLMTGLELHQSLLALCLTIPMTAFDLLL
jgi:FixJ family two-component response regulator